MGEHLGSLAKSVETPVDPDNSNYKGPCRLCRERRRKRMSREIVHLPEASRGITENPATLRIRTPESFHGVCGPSSYSKLARCFFSHAFARFSVQHTTAKLRENGTRPGPKRTE